MKLKLKLWNKAQRIMSEPFYLNDLHTTDDLGFFKGVPDWDCMDSFANVDILQYSGLKSSDGKEIYHNDVVYVSGVGVVTAKAPFTDLILADQENDIGEHMGNEYEATDWDKTLWEVMHYSENPIEINRE